MNQGHMVLQNYCTRLRLGELFRNAVSSDNWDLADGVQFPTRWWMHFPFSPWTERLLCNFHPVLTTRPIYCRGLEWLFYSYMHDTKVHGNRFTVSVITGLWKKKKASIFIRTKPLFRAHSDLIKGPISAWPVYHLSVSITTTVIVGFIVILTRHQIVPNSFRSTP